MRMTNGLVFASYTFQFFPAFLRRYLRVRQPGNAGGSSVSVDRAGAINAANQYDQDGGYTRNCVA